MFEQGRRIFPVPELVPFRFTRDIVDPIASDAIRARFFHTAVNTLQQLRLHSEVNPG